MSTTAYCLNELRKSSHVADDVLLETIDGFRRKHATLEEVNGTELDLRDESYANNLFAWFQSEHGGLLEDSTEVTRTASLFRDLISGLDLSFETEQITERQKSTILKYYDEASSKDFVCGRCNSTEVGLPVRMPKATTLLCDGCSSALRKMATQLYWERCTCGTTRMWWVTVGNETKIHRLEGRVACHECIKCYPGCTKVKVDDAGIQRLAGHGRTILAKIPQPGLSDERIKLTLDQMPDEEVLEKLRQHLDGIPGAERSSFMASFEKEQGLK